MSKHGSSLVVMIKHGWIEEMTSNVKSINGNHLLEVGLEGFYGEYFITNNQIKGIDFATIHSYTEIW